MSLTAELRRWWRARQSNTVALLAKSEARERLDLGVARVSEDLVTVRDELAGLKRDLARLEVVAHTRQAVRRQVPDGATVLVVSGGDRDLIDDLDERVGLHFPQTGDGAHADRHPATSEEAIEQLAELNAKGASFIVFPSSARWWLHRYDGLRQHLAANHRPVTSPDETCAIFELSGPSSRRGPTERERRQRLESQTARLADDLLGVRTDVAALKKGIARWDVIAQTRRLVDEVVPPRATVIVVSKGDHELAELGDRVVWHFPRAESGVYAGYHPATSDDAIRHLEALREEGARFLVFPASSVWWLDHYDGLRRHLDVNHRLVVRSKDSCTIYELAPDAVRPVAGNGAALPVDAERAAMPVAADRGRAPVHANGATAPNGIDAAAAPVAIGASSEHELMTIGDGPFAADVESARRILGSKPPTVSVVVPTYNRQKELRRALTSALRQSLQPLEVIVSDDGSTDGTEAMLRREFARELDAGRLRYVRGESRRGSAAARNAGLRLAQGDLIAYLDSDNAWHDQFLLVMAAALAGRDDAATAYCGFVLRRDDEPMQPRYEAYDRSQLLVRNHIDLNAFVHWRRVYEQLGGFDEDLTRLVDWELVLRYTQRYRPVEVPLHLVDYYAGDAGGRITSTEDFDENAERVRRGIAHELVYRGLSPLRLGYVIWDFPALSQTFVINEIRRLRESGYDVNVYFHTAPDRAAVLDFDVPTFQVDDADDLAKKIKAHGRTMLHSHFVYPAVTRLTYPAALAAGVPFTFMVHAVDIFHQANKARNRIDEITQDPLCLRVFCPGRFHRTFLSERGVPLEKIGFVRQASNISPAPRRSVEERLLRPRRVIACIARFVDKKGIDDLIRAGAILGDQVEIRLYGYGPREESYRALADQLGATCVRFAGVLEGRAAVGSALADADLFVLPCVMDENGDMDGLPTVIGEAMAAGVPVVTTDVSSIPEVVEDGITGFLVPPRDPESLARRISEVIELDTETLRRVAGAAQDAVAAIWNIERAVETLLDAWERPPVEIALVTYSRDEPDGAATTAEIIRRLYEMTSTSFNLTIVDNNSDAQYVAALQRAIDGRRNASLVLLDKNRHWGPAVNLAWDGAASECLLYVCSKEGFVLKPGWEREYIDHLRAERDVALAGHLISSPAFPTGSAYAEQQWFSGFRNKRFAQRNPTREFFHVQGGLFALRRSVFETCGRFSEYVAQNAADIEYSYFLESLGWRLGSVSTMPSVTKKTLPRVYAHLDEHTVAAHPLSLESIELAARVTSGSGTFCNLCSWSGDAFVADNGKGETCPACGSTPFGRLLFRYLAGSALPYRKLECAAIVDDDAVAEALSQMFVLTRLEADALDEGLGRHDLVIADMHGAGTSEIPKKVRNLVAGLDHAGLAIVGPPAGPGYRGQGASVATAFAAIGYRSSGVSISSRALCFARDGLVVARRENGDSKTEVVG